MDTSAVDRAIIVSSGRCGSTLLSDLLAAEDETLSAQEFFVSVMFRGLTTDVVTGEEYWTFLANPKPELSTLFRLGFVPAELNQYPHDGRWSGRLTELPRILAATLPKLTRDPDALFDRLAELVPQFPEQPLSQHHRMFLDLLATLHGRRRWVERSGGSSHFAPYLLENFDDAKIVYLTRDWHDTARSMFQRPSMWLSKLQFENMARFGIDLFRLEPGQQVPSELENLRPHRLTGEMLRERSGSVDYYVSLCASRHAAAERAIADTPPKALLRMRYEDLLLDPAAELHRLGQFLGLTDPAEWARHTAGRVRSPARSI